MSVFAAMPRLAPIFVLVTLSALVPHIGVAASWADPAKVLRIALSTDISGLDPAATQDVSAHMIEDRIFDTLYTWGYLARPYRFVPSVAQGMPDISSDGLTWTIRLKQGIYFADDPAFAGVRRELIAADFVYSWKRLADPRIRSPNVNLIDGKLAGLDAAIAHARVSGRFDYDAEVAGLRAIDRHTLQIRLLERDYTFLESLNATALSAVAREVVERYADASGRVMENPVGTGPYRLKNWQRSRRVLLEANPGFREVRFPQAAPTADATTRAMAVAMKDAHIPQIGIVDFAVVEESQPRLLMLNAGALDILAIPTDLTPAVIDRSDRLLPEYAKRGFALHRGLDPAVSFAFFNMDDPVVGGYTPARIALRRAICSAYNVADEIRVLRNGQGVLATQPIPPDFAGHVRGFKGVVHYNPAHARTLLDRFGYRDRDGDGYREAPDGKPLLLQMATETLSISRRYDELWQRSLVAVGIRMEFQAQTLQELAKASRAGHLQMRKLSLYSDSADGFMQFFHGPNAGTINHARFRNSQFDALVLQSRGILEGPGRDKLYEEMTRLVAAYSPWCPTVFPIRNTVVAPRMRGFMRNVHHLIPPWQYLDIDLGVRTGARP